ncbi:MAG: hypothetical protein EOM03_14430, partial [Clostridia bacterium]|nr:hypothetical protein [Clostridia bacterium]
MIYTKTCVIACFWGIGRTTFSAKENKHEGSTFCLDMDYDGTNLRAFIAQVKAERAKIAHRYILVPMDAEILMAFRENGIDHITVVPDSDDRNDWMIRWMHSGATAKMITARSSDSTIWAKRKVNEMDELKP